MISSRAEDGRSEKPHNGERSWAKSAGGRARDGEWRCLNGTGQWSPSPHHMTVLGEVAGLVSTFAPRDKACYL